jgi:phosphoglycolate phosphatase-like HAD superfamily hydrolase
MQIRQPQHFVVSDTPNPMALACAINRNALDGKVSVVGDYPNESRGQ